MALFVVIAKDKPDSLPLRLATRPQHLEFLNELKAQGKLQLAGPMPVNPAQLSDGVHGSLLIVDFDSLDEVHHWLAQDPYNQAGLFESVTVYPFIAALSKEP